MNLSRRKFLSGAAAGVAVMAMPLPILPSAPASIAMLPPSCASAYFELLRLAVNEVEGITGLPLEMLGVR